MLTLNVKAPFVLTQLARPLLDAASTEDDPARVINIGSIDGLVVPRMGTFAYSSSKAALHQLTRHMAHELAPKILVNAIAPGPFQSKMMAATLDAVGDRLAASTSPSNGSAAPRTSPRRRSTWRRGPPTSSPARCSPSTAGSARRSACRSEAR